MGDIKFYLCTGMYVCLPSIWFPPNNISFPSANWGAIKGRPSPISDYPFSHSGVVPPIYFSQKQGHLYPWNTILKFSLLKSVWLLGQCYPHWLLGQCYPDWLLGQCYPDWLLGQCYPDRQKLFYLSL